MKKILNQAADFVPEMLDGLLKAHPDQLAYAGDDVHCIVRADAPVAGQGRAGHRRRLGPPPRLPGLRGQGHARRLRRGRRVRLAQRRPDAGSHQAHPRRQGRGLHLRQLRRRRHELRHGRRDGRRSKTSRCAPCWSRTTWPRPRRTKPHAGAAWPAWSSPLRSAAPRPTRAARSTRWWRRPRRRWPTSARWAWRCRPAPCPRAGKPTFTIGEDEMEIGMGIHGEPGMKREKLQTADEITERMTTAILDDLQPAAGDRLAVMVNGLGATPPEELYIIYRKVHAILSGPGHQRAPRLRRRVCHLDGDGRRVAHALPAGRRAGSPARPPGAHALLYAGIAS